MLRSRRALSSFVGPFAAAGLLVLACTSDDPPPPTTPGDTPSDADAAMDVLFRRPAREIIECRAGALLDGDANADMLAFIEDSLAGALGDADSLTMYYGTYADTSPSGSDGTGVVKVSGEPADAIRFELAGTDSSGAPLSGSLTIGDVSVSIVENETGVEITAGASLALVEDGGDDIVFTGTLVAHLERPPGARAGPSSGGLTFVSFEGEGNVCELDYELTVTWSRETAKLDVAGSYVLDVRVGFHFCAFGADTTAVDSVTADVWIGSRGNPLARATATYDPGASSDCVTGAVYTGGVMRGDIIATGCGTDALMVFIVTDTDTIPLGDIFEDLGRASHGGGSRSWASER